MAILVNFFKLGVLRMIFSKEQPCWTKDIFEKLS
jgi:hypothetical protein